MSVQVLAESKHATTVELAARESEFQNMTQQLASKDRLLLERARHFPGVSVSGKNLKRAPIKRERVILYIADSGNHRVLQWVVGDDQGTTDLPEHHGREERERG